MDDVKESSTLTDGEQSALNEIYSSEYQSILSHIRKKLPGGHGAEDLAADVFIRATRHMDDLSGKPPDQQKRLLFSYANSIVAEHRRKTARRNTVSFADVGGDDGESAFEDGIPSAADIEAEYVDSELKLAMIAEINSLEPKKKQAIIMRYVKGMNTDDIARRLDMNPSTLRSLLKNTLAELRARLEDYHG